MSVTKVHFWIYGILMFLPVLVAAERNSSDANELTISSCALGNASQLQHYCTETHDPQDAVAIENLNTIAITEKLCGEYSHHQVQTCRNIMLLFLSSDTKGLCVSSSIANVSNSSMTTQQTNIINAINHKYVSYCGNAGTLLIVGHYVFSCTLQNVDELEKVEFIIGGYNASIRDYWSATVRVTINHHCSKETPKVSTSYYIAPAAQNYLIAMPLPTLTIGITTTLISIIVAGIVIFFISTYAKHACLKKSASEAEISCEQGTDSTTFKNPVAADDHTNNLEQRSCPVPIHAALHTAAGDQRNMVMDCPVLTNPTASRRDVSTKNHTTSENNDLEVHSESIVIEALKSSDHQDVASCQCITSGNKSNQEGNSTISECINSEAASVLVYSSSKQCNIKAKPCGPQLATSPCGSPTNVSLPGNKRTSMSTDTLKRYIKRTSAAQEVTSLHTAPNTLSSEVVSNDNLPHRQTTIEEEQQN